VSGNTYTTVSAGRVHTCAVDDSGGAWCWGSNENGRLGDNTTVDHQSPTTVTGLAAGVAKVFAGGHHTCVLREDGTAWCWGRNGDGQLGDGTTQDQHTAVAVTTSP
jgi:hypothetical protein